MKNQMSKEYSWTDQRDDIWRHDKFASIEACIKDAICCGKKPGEKIMIGLCENYVPYASANALLEQVSEDAYNEVGEVAEDWPEFIGRKGYKDAEKLQEKLDKVLTEWLEETKQVPSFYRILPLADPVIIPKKK